MLSGWPTASATSISDASRCMKQRRLATPVSGSSCDSRSSTQAAFAQHRDQPFLLGVRLLEFGRALRDALLEMTAIVLEVLECARVGERTRDLLAQLPHQMQIGVGVVPASVCCTLNRPSTMPSLTSGTASNEPVAFSVASARCSNSGGASSPILDDQRLRARNQPAEQAGVDGLEPRGQPNLVLVRAAGCPACVARDRRARDTTHRSGTGCVSRPGCARRDRRPGARPATQGRPRTGA